jgi:hypothetical protein
MPQVVFSIGNPIRFSATLGYLKEIHRIARGHILHIGADLIERRHGLSA